MTLRLVVEHSLHPQSRGEFLHHGGDISIGRGTDCTWQIDDPDMFISRKHCVVTVRDNAFSITDFSRGGVFLDGASTPVGTGNTARLEHGTRIRMGDVVLRAEILSTEPARVSPTSSIERSSLGLKDDDFFARKGDPPVPPKRPATLPQEFDSGRISRPLSEQARDRPALRPLSDDPFMMDPLRSAGRTADEVTEVGNRVQTWRSVSRQPDTQDDNPRRVDPPRVEAVTSAGTDAYATAGRGFGTGDAAKAQAEGSNRLVDLERNPHFGEAKVVAIQSGSSGDDTAARLAFFKGLGLDPVDFLQNGSTEAEMEALGRRFRLLADGLVQLLRMRAKEKGSVRVTQTVIGSANVNPLKFLATADDTLGALIKPRGKGYLPPEDAIAAAYRDLSDHHVRTWTAIQQALRSMIDRFDPQTFEQAADAEGMLKTFLSGGRGSKLWQLYSARYREIAKAAEDEFLGEVGADFRDAYEGKRRGE